MRHCPDRTMTERYTFVCYAHDDADFARALTRAMTEHGLSMWLDIDIVPGADWDRTIDERLRECATVLIVLSPAAVASAEVRGELRAALTLDKPIVPLLYQPCEIPRQLQNVQYLDFTTVGARVDAYDAVAAALSSSLHTDERPPRRVKLAGRALRNRLDYLDDVKSEIGGRLAQSLHPGRLNVMKEKRPGLVVRPWDADVRIAEHERTPLPADAKIADVFDDGTVRGRLLILGEPGSGKTTAMLELGQELVARAEADDARPLPVLCNLASWRDAGGTLGAWIVDQLKIKYGVRKDNGLAWLNDRLLVPLLDGLDEVQPEYQEPCIEAINRFQDDDRPPHLVVCCRAAAYANYRVRLKLNTAIQVLALDDDQIRSYLTGAGCAELWQDVGTDPASMGLARSPLLLRIMTVAYAEGAPDEWRRLTPTPERQSHLFDVYIRRLLSDDGTQRYAKGQTLRWLSWLARAMQQRGQAEFLLEQLQPAWLPSAVHRWFYRIGVAVTCFAVVFLVMSLVEMLTDLVPAGRVASRSSAVLERSMGRGGWPNQFAAFVTIFGVASGAFMASRSRIRPIETLVWSRRRAWRRMIDELKRAGITWLNRIAYVGLLGGLLSGVALPLNLLRDDGPASGLAAWSTAGYLANAVSLCTLVVVAALTLKPSTWLFGDRSVWSRRGSSDAVLSGVVFGLAVSPTRGLLFGLLSGVALAGILGVCGGSTALPAPAFARALVIGLAGGVGVGAITWWMMGLPSALLIDWVIAWLIGGAGVAVIFVLYGTVASRLSGGRAGRLSHVVGRLSAWRWRRWLLVAGIMALLGGALLGIIGRFNSVAVRGIGWMSFLVGLGWSGALSSSLLTASVGAAVGMMMGGFLGALYGLLGGLTGPDIERRTQPNQGIWQSAANVGIFAVLGGLMIGIPWGLMNIAAGAVLTRTVPSATDWLRFVVFPAFSFALLGGLVPGAACIQHFVLRCILSATGLAPWRYSRFLDYVTERLLLQRIGGRYRFMHDLLRDHFAGMQLAAPARDAAGDFGTAGSR